MDWSGGVDYGMDCGMGINFENKFSIAINNYCVVDDLLNLLRASSGL